MKKENYRVDAFNTGAEALACFKEGIYDIAVLDFKMPNMDGFEVYEKMHLIDPNMRVLFISGDHSHYRENISAHPELNAKHFLNKPTSLNDLIKRIKEILLAA